MMQTMSLHQPISAGIEALLVDPIIRQVMDSDGVSPRELRAICHDARLRLLRGRSGAGGTRSSSH
jgi:hypothetical protein